ncbi:MAG: hypothetical protein AAF802_01055 [Planctomycetota bacterium]
MTNYQLQATDALIRFRNEQGFEIPENLETVRRHLANGNSIEAASVARQIKVFGRNSLHSIPRVMEDSDRAYIRVLHESLLRNWQLWISILTPGPQGKKISRMLRQVDTDPAPVQA